MNGACSLMIIRLIGSGLFFSAMNKPVTVKIYGNNQQSIQQTEHEITRLIQSRCLKAEINDNVLRSLSSAKVCDYMMHTNQNLI